MSHLNSHASSLLPRCPLRRRLSLSVNHTGSTGCSNTQWRLIRVRQVTPRRRRSLKNSTFDARLPECRPHIRRPPDETCFFSWSSSVMHRYGRPLPRSRILVPEVAILTIVFPRRNLAHLPTAPSSPEILILLLSRSIFTPFFVNLEHVWQVFHAQDTGSR